MNESKLININIKNKPKHIDIYLFRICMCKVGCLSLKYCWCKKYLIPSYNQHLIGSFLSVIAPPPITNNQTLFRFANNQHSWSGSNMQMQRYSAGTVQVLQLVLYSAPSVPQPVFTIMEKAPTRAFSWLKAPSTFTDKTQLRHYAKQALTPW